METEISERNFKRAIRTWAATTEHALYLAPFLAVQEAERANADDDQERWWLWDDEKAVRKCMETAWQLAGEWTALRGAAPVRQQSFQSAVLESVCALARTLNRRGVKDLLAVGNLGRTDYIQVVSSVERYVEKVSKTKRTVEPQPVLGSKILHHFFPSVVPVYDVKWISQKALRHKGYRKFSEMNRNQWVSNEYDDDSSMWEYDYYFRYCAQQVSDTPSKTLQDLRSRLAGLYADLAPRVLYERRRSLLWRLDAKIAEYCLIGATY